MSEQAGFNIEWTAEHRRQGRLISRQCNILGAPQPLNCMKASALWRYFKEAMHYLLLCIYHKQRVQYAERHPDLNMPEKYRSGNNVPKTNIGLLFSSLVIKIRGLI